MSERSIGSCWRRFREHRAFQQTKVGLRDGVRAMGKVLSQMPDGELGPAWPHKRAGRYGAEGGPKRSSHGLSQRGNSAGRTAEGRRRPCGQAARQELGRCEQGHDVSGV